jgi:hypothetical protein
MAAYGVQDIGRVLSIDPKTLRKHYREELDVGGTKANAQVAGYLSNAAKGGNVIHGTDILVEDPGALARSPAGAAAFRLDREKRSRRNDGRRTIRLDLPNGVRSRWSPSMRKRRPLWSGHSNVEAQIRARD